MVSRLFNRNAERLQEAYVLRREGVASLCTVLFSCRFEDCPGLLFQLIQPNRRLKHQQYIESLLANVFHHASDVFRFGNAFMNSFAQLLDKVPQFLVQGFAPFPRRVVRGAFFRGFPYITSDARWRQCESIIRCYTFVYGAEPFWPQTRCRRPCRFGNDPRSRFASRSFHAARSCWSAAAGCGLRPARSRAWTSCRRWCKKFRQISLGTIRSCRRCSLARGDGPFLCAVWSLLCAKRLQAAPRVELRS